MIKPISIVIPVWNEIKTIETLIRRIDHTCKKEKLPYTIIIVDDHSTDGTVEKIVQLLHLFPIKLFVKPVSIPRGKANSLLYGFSQAVTDKVVMIDADLQYPPEAIPDLIQQLDDNGVSVARRSEYSESAVRKFVSTMFHAVFGTWIHGFTCDVQSGLKAFRKEILEHIDVRFITPWTFDLTLLITTRNLGYKIGEVSITFEARKYGHSKVNLVKASWEIGINAILLKLKSPDSYVIKPKTADSMAGAGLIHKKKRFITHTTLKHSESAVQTFTLWQKVAGITLLMLFVLGLFVNSQNTLIFLMGLLSIIYFSDVCFNFYLIVKSLYFPPEIVYKAEDFEVENENSLPVYTILCPLYKEAAVLPEFISAIQKLDWPKEKLEVLLLLEQDDEETLSAIEELELPAYIRPIVVPHSLPKTKPKACNYGLSQAKGEYVVIYDAEDRPDPNQLKKAYSTFNKLPDTVVCLQAKLNYHNPNQNLLTRLFTAEYSLWFDIILNGLQTINTVIPLGGTSNHFRSSVLRSLKGWDPFNVTEDCDLGVRLFKRGYQTAIIDSTTYEEANSSLPNWIRQRSRWIKGYFQTFFVHNRQPLTFIENHGVHAFLFQLIIGARMVFMLINPLLWMMTVAYFVFNPWVGTQIEAIFPTTVFYLAAFSLILGNFLYIFNYMIGCAKRGSWSLIKYVYLIPLYWLMASWAAMMALYQLLVKPHYWEKTIHGLHLKPKAPAPAVTASFIKANSVLIGGFLLVLATMLANVGNFLFNTYLSHHLSFEQFGDFSLFASFTALAMLPLGALSITISHRTALLTGKNNADGAVVYTSTILKRVIGPLAGVTLLWLVSIPYLVNFFQIHSIIPFLIFSPIWIIGLLMYGLMGYLRGALRFNTIALITVADIAVKIILAYVLVSIGQTELMVIVFPLAFLAQLLFSWLAFPKQKSKTLSPKKLAFDTGFFASTLAATISTVMFVGIDIILAKHYLSAFEAGQYSVLSLVGKIIFFAGSLLIQFMIPLVSRNEGAKKSSRSVFLMVFGSTGLIVALCYLFFGVYGRMVVPLLFGIKSVAIVPYLPWYLLAVSLFILTMPITSFYQAKRKYVYALVSFLMSLLQIILISRFHQSLTQFITVMTGVSFIYFLNVLVLHFVQHDARFVAQNLKSLWNFLFTPSPIPDKNISLTSMRILVFNWRDTKHSWAGGAEVYIHECAKRWVQSGHKVTVFCGNDGNNKNDERIDGVQIIRRGGLFTVYVWAFLYYIFRFRGHFDVVVDSENCVPFFTPLYVWQPKFLLIHHIHKEVFLRHLPAPLSWIAFITESYLMPLVYRHQPVITVSESTKQEILKMRLGTADTISIINPGVEVKQPLTKYKANYPFFSYVGRLKPYKNIDIVLKAFKNLLVIHPQATLTIAGTGESMLALQKLAKDLHVEAAVHFPGKISETQKANLMASSWAMLQPSMIEGWGITVIEANSVGTPVIASNVNGLRDSVLNLKTGILVPPRNVDSFSRSMDIMIRNSELREQLSLNALRWSQNFSWDKSAQEFITCINEKLTVKSNYRIEDLAVKPINDI